MVIEKLTFWEENMRVSALVPEIYRDYRDAHIHYAIRIGKFNKFIQNSASEFVSFELWGILKFFKRDKKRLRLL